jgi:hypothetical protein
MKTINYILIAVAVVILVHLFFKNNIIDYNPEQKATTNVENYDTLGGCQPYKRELSLCNRPKRKYVDPRKDLCNMELSKNNDIDKNTYLTKLMVGQRDEYVAPVKSIKQFNKEFFDFRNMTETNTSIKEDAVDRIHQLYLQGNLSEARNRPGMKIKDIYDESVNGPNLYEKRCVRLPQFDNINYDGYQMSYGQHPMHLTRDKWTYPKEKIMNGGAIKPYLYGYDLEANSYMPISLFESANKN